MHGGTGPIMSAERRRGRKIYLIGFSGSGKSTVGPALAARLGIAFVDLDSALVRRFGQPVPAIFAAEGERAFRNAETELLREIVSRTKKSEVVALGGGAFQRAANRDLVMRSGVSVYLSCAQREILRRLKRQSDRPLLHGKPRSGETRFAAMRRRVADLLAQRIATYRQADLTVSVTSRTPVQAVAEIIRLLRQEATEP